MDLHWKLWERVGLRPFVMVFLVEGRIVGVAPLILKSRLYLGSVSNFDEYTLPAFFVDKYREVCIDFMVGFLFGRLGCRLI